jgi:geranylgeranyl diphosphate synthase type II
MSFDCDSTGSVLGDIRSRANEIRKRINDRLAELIPPESAEPQQLHRAMRYGLLGSGKRIRPVVTVMVAAKLGGDESLAIDPACAIELVHTASLILDDLPLMDDATLRRGQPATHIVFGEGTALLAAMALLNCAYVTIASAPRLGPELRLRLVSMLCDAIGSDGLIGGQMLDLENWPGLDADSIEQTNMLKTAALFVLGAEAGARIAEVPEHEVRAVREFARNIGLAFQMFDDLLDVSHTEAEAGKNVAQDEGKVTLVSLLGTERAQSWANRLLQSAVDSLAPLGTRGDSIVELAQLFLPEGSAASGGGAQS